jgi:hypothetical protein
MEYTAIENLRCEQARIDMMRRALEGMNFTPTRASQDVRELLVKLRDHSDAVSVDLHNVGARGS